MRISNQKLWADGFKGEDLNAVKHLIHAYAGDEYPCQVIVGTDIEGRTFVILHFDDGRGNRDFEVFPFDSEQFATAAVALLHEIARHQLNQFRREIPARLKGASLHEENFGADD